MSGTWNFKLNYAGGSNILKNNEKLRQLEEQMIQERLSRIQAQFISDFGTEGNFEIKFTVGQARMNYRIVAADAKTGAILKNHPKWLEKVA